MPDASCTQSSPKSALVHKVYLAYHDVSPLITSQLLQPVHVGRALSAKALPGTIGDDSGEHISSRNPEYSELTAQYWAWKNDLSAQTIGLMHYRRLIDLTNMAPHSRHPEQFVTRFCAATYARIAERFLAENAQFDIILPRPLTLRKNLCQQYAACHESADLDALCTIIAEHRPDFLSSFEQALEDNQLCLGNIFMMKRSYFENYCALLFPLLEQLYHKNTREGRSLYQRRYIGFLAERVLTAYRLFVSRTDDVKKPKIIYRDILNISQTIRRDLNLVQITKLAAKGQIGWRDTAHLISGIS